MTDYVHRISDEERERIRRFVRMGAAITGLFVAIVIVAVLTARHWVTLISPGSERQFVRPHVAWLHRHILEESDPVLQDYVAQLGAELAAGGGGEGRRAEGRDVENPDARQRPWIRRLGRITGRH